MKVIIELPEDDVEFIRIMSVKIGFKNMEEMIIFAIKYLIESRLQKDN
ncbi:MAG: hypothetical protein ACTSRG_25885 [Candidatus Helarchaeota archaeon]